MTASVRPLRALVAALLSCTAASWCTSCGDLGEGDDDELCGDGDVDSSVEDCDGRDLNGATCATATSGRRPLGRLACDESCSFDTSSCLPASSPPDSGRPEYDACPGERITLTVTERTASRTFATEDLLDQFTPYCAYDAAAPDAVFDVRIQHTGTLTVEAASEDGVFVPVVLVRRAQSVSDSEACEDSATTLLCTTGVVERSPPSGNGPADAGSVPDALVSVDASSPGDLDASSPGVADAASPSEAGIQDAGSPDASASGRRIAKATMAVISGERLSVIVDGASAATGVVSLSLNLADAACPDGVVNAPLGEECDDGDRDEGDGCDRNCKREVPPDDSCSTATFLGAALVPGRSEVVEGNTVGAKDDYEASCGRKKGAPDRVYGFVTSTGGTLTASLEGTFDGVLSVWRTCDTSERLSGVIACSDGPIASDTERVEQVIPAGTYYVVVDGFDPEAFGTYVLRVGLADDDAP